MPNWQRLIVGNAFRVYSRDVNYYRDLALFWPFLLFSIIAISDFFSRSNTNRHVLIMTAIAAACLVLAKEKLYLLLVSVGFIALRCVWALVIVARDLKVVVVLAVSLGVLAVIFFGLRNRRLSYKLPENSGTLDLLIGIGSLVGTIALKIWLDKILA